MSPSEILRSTEMAVGIDELYNCHQSLIEMGEKLSIFDTQFKSEQNRLARKQQGINRIGSDVEKLEEQKRNSDILKMLKIKQSWLKYNEQASSAIELKNQRNKLEKTIKDIKEEIEPQLSDRNSHNDKLKSYLQNFSSKVFYFS